ncbi:alkaline phosphatase [Shewanella sp. KX20019]|uniref:alkaline phosphatase n=1 Tax=Shewanella sp. KX20019 TaxID=2803864 RepID=UPI00192713AE|nr:alkaline phosphatase [Shewanella sp. KX20019]QQX81401.1 alkaline phosphatase [Shewanella sp. KX20019]
MNAVKFSHPRPRLSAISTLALFIGTISASLSFTLSADDKTPIPDEEVPKNIIYLIGDGMGPAYTSAYRYFSDRPDTKAVEKTIFDQLLVGMSSTYPDDDTYVTDSAAAATALATSIKTYNGAISVDHQHDSLPTMMEVAKEMGKTTAIVVTSQINHATPASFLAHNESRRNYDEIADSYLTNLINGQPVAELMLGGGQQYFVRDDKDLTKSFNKHGYHYIDSIADLDQLDQLPALGLFSQKGLEPALGSKYPVRLMQMTKKALQLVSASKKPFVMMVEASQIDWCGHSNDISCAMAEMDDLSQTVNVIKAYIDTHPDTLLVMTADHSTGGLSLGRDGTYQWKGQLLKNVTMMPSAIAASLLKSEQPLTLWQQATQLPLTKEQQTQLTANIATAKSATEPTRKLTSSIKKLIDEVTFTGWTTSGHDAVDVPVFAYGMGSDAFIGHQDNTDIATTLMQMIAR